jgi:hypothetical protein
MMLSLALSMALLTSSGGLLSEHLPAGVRLLDAASVVPGAFLGARARDRDDGISSAQLQSMSLEQLRSEYDRLEDEKPSLGLGIGLLVGGIASLTTWLVLWIVAAQVVSTAAFWVGFVFLPVGIVLTIIGAINLARASRERRRDSRDQEMLMRQIRLLEGGGQGGPLPPLPTGPTPPPPPPPPPLGGVPMVEPQLLVASF